MPTAEELAEQRVRERECERQLELLRQRARDDERVAALRRSDSSGSEGEHALAAAVTALRVRAARSCVAPAPPAAALWAALAPRLAPHAAALAWPAPAAQLQRGVRAAGAALAGARAGWPDGELLSAGALLSVAALAHESRSRRAAARALHALLDDRATPAQVSLLTSALLAALPDARARLQLGDALRSGGDGGADRAAFALTAAAMLDLLRAPAQDGAEGEAESVERVARAAPAWRTCDADTRYVCVQLAGRLLAATSGATDATSATSGTTDAPCGVTDATSATSDVTDATSATSDVTGATSTTSGTTDAPCGVTDATSATSDVTGATSATSGTTDAPCGVTDATSATSDVTGATSATSGTTDAPCGVTDATSATSDVTDATSATSDVTGATSTTSGITDATCGATDGPRATSGATDAPRATSGVTDSPRTTQEARSDAPRTTQEARSDAPRTTQEARSRLLALLAPPPAGARDAQRPDRLKASVGASKLKLLFCAKNGDSRQPRAQRDTST